MKQATDFGHQMPKAHKMMRVVFTLTGKIPRRV